ncbi:hypothetical protein CEUSTIGMA_g13420.t1 [Chlamydomonas eustigma]|uniref:PDEase domain-containing protein n=1 Tax=Chlamydomonas eustigma TaxID=1157962 RepID=A0A250XSG5_9CHLO|nr:hypothetical protein CEUSTIGMA_g13420.t1 [Chlamydomonas eustigma]|eukprot:GAX86004.1 hypothetical protein CEUSTIGMA_g13420.t1 [Chlamydomonas eustigma]
MTTHLGLRPLLARAIDLFFDRPPTVGQEGEDDYDLGVFFVKYIVDSGQRQLLEAYAHDIPDFLNVLTHDASLGCSGLLNFKYSICVDEGGSSDLKVHVQESGGGSNSSGDSFEGAGMRRGTGPDFLLGMLGALSSHNLYSIKSVRKIVDVSGLAAPTRQGSTGAVEKRYTCSIQLMSKKSLPSSPIMRRLVSSAPQITTTPFSSISIAEGEGSNQPHRTSALSLSEMEASVLSLAQPFHLQVDLEGHLLQAGSLMKKYWGRRGVTWKGMHVSDLMKILSRPRMDDEKISGAIPSDHFPWPDLQRLLTVQASIDGQNSLTSSTWILETRDNTLNVLDDNGLFAAIGKSLSSSSSPMAVPEPCLKLKGIWLKMPTVEAPSSSRADPCGGVNDPGSSATGEDPCGGVNDAGSSATGVERFVFCGTALMESFSEILALGFRLSDLPSTDLSADYCVMREQLQADMKVYKRHQQEAELEASLCSRQLFTIPSSNLSGTAPDENTSSTGESGLGHFCLNRRDSSSTSVFMTTRAASVSNSFGGFAMLPNSLQSRRSSSTSRGPPPAELVTSASVALRVLERTLMGEAVPQVDIRTAHNLLHHSIALIHSGYPSGGSQQDSLLQASSPRGGSEARVLSADHLPPLLSGDPVDPFKNLPSSVHSGNHMMHTHNETMSTWALANASTTYSGNSAFQHSGPLQSRGMGRGSTGTKPSWSDLVASVPVSKEYLSQGSIQGKENEDVKQSLMEMITGRHALEPSPVEPQNDDIEDSNSSCMYDDESYDDGMQEDLESGHYGQCGTGVVRENLLLLAQASDGLDTSDNSNQVSSLVADHLRLASLRSREEISRGVENNVVTGERSGVQLQKEADQKLGVNSKGLDTSDPDASGRSISDPVLDLVPGIRTERFERTGIHMLEATTSQSVTGPRLPVSTAADNAATAIKLLGPSHTSDVGVSNNPLVDLASAELIKLSDAPNSPPRKVGDNGFAPLPLLSPQPNGGRDVQQQSKEDALSCSVLAGGSSRPPSTESSLLVQIEAGSVLSLQQKNRADEGTRRNVDLPLRDLKRSVSFLERIRSNLLSCISPNQEGLHYDSVSDTLADVSSCGRRVSRYKEHQDTTRASLQETSPSDDDHHRVSTQQPPHISMTILRDQNSRDEGPSRSMVSKEPPTVVDKEVQVSEGIINGVGRGGCQLGPSESVAVTSLSYHWREEAIASLTRPISDQVMAALSRVDEWTYDIFQLSEATGGRPLSTLAFFLIRRMGLSRVMQLDEAKLARFLICIEDGYRDNPYHNRTHAADVLRNVHVITVRGGLLRILGSKRLKPGGQKTSGSKPQNTISNGGGLKSKLGSPRTSRRNLMTQRNSNFPLREKSALQQGIRMNSSSLVCPAASNASKTSSGNSPAAPSPSAVNRAPTEAPGQEFTHANPATQDAMILLCQYMSAVIHDHDHGGVTNAFLIVDQHPLAMLYNDMSPMENHHISSAFILMMEEQNNFLCNCSRPVRDRVRDKIIQLVLGTDMKQHFNLSGNFSSKLLPNLLEAAKEKKKKKLHVGFMDSSTEIPLLSPKSITLAVEAIAHQQAQDEGALEAIAHQQAQDEGMLSSSGNVRSLSRIGSQRSDAGSMKPQITDCLSGVWKGTAPDHGASGTLKLTADSSSGTQMQDEGSPTTLHTTRPITLSAIPAGTLVTAPNSDNLSPGALFVPQQLSAPLPSSNLPLPPKSNLGQCALIQSGQHRSTELNLLSGYSTPANKMGSLITPLRCMPLDEEERLLVWKVALKCADLGHLASPLHVHRKWVHLLEEEMFRQGDLEKERGYAVSPLMDRSKAGITKSQPGFFNVIVLPLFSSFASALPAAEPLLEQVKRNYEMWSREVPV